MFKVMSPDQLHIHRDDEKMKKFFEFMIEFSVIFYQKTEHKIGHIRPYIVDTDLEDGGSNSTNKNNEGIV